MRQVRLFIFDLDGTLIDSKRDIAESVNYTMGILDLPCLPHETIYEFVGNGVTPLIQRAVDAAGGIEFDHALEIFKAHYLDHCLDSTTLFPGVAEVLQHFASTPKIVLTNKSQNFSEKILMGLGLTPKLHGIYGGDTSFPKKPDPTIVYHLMKESGVSPDQTIIVGDSRVDMDTGKNAGILTCGVTYGFRPLEEIVGCQPDYLIQEAVDLIGLFGGTGKKGCGNVPPTGIEPVFKV